MVITDLKNEFHPVPKQARIKNKKLLKDKKGIFKYVVKRHLQRNIIKNKRFWWR